MAARIERRQHIEPIFKKSPTPRDRPIPKKVESNWDRVVPIMQKGAQLAGMFNKPKGQPPDGLRRFEEGVKTYMTKGFTPEQRIQEGWTKKFFDSELTPEKLKAFDSTLDFKPDQFKKLLEYATNNGALADWNSTNLRAMAASEIAHDPDRAIQVSKSTGQVFVTGLSATLKGFGIDPNSFLTKEQQTGFEDVGMKTAIDALEDLGLSGQGNAAILGINTALEDGRVSKVFAEKAKNRVRIKQFERRNRIETYKRWQETDAERRHAKRIATGAGSTTDLLAGINADTFQEKEVLKRGAGLYAEQKYTVQQIVDKAKAVGANVSEGRKNDLVAEMTQAFRAQNDASVLGVPPQAGMPSAPYQALTPGSADAVDHVHNYMMKNNQAYAQTNAEGRKAILTEMMRDSKAFKGVWDGTGFGQVLRGDGEKLGDGADGFSAVGMDVSRAIVMGLNGDFEGLAAFNEEMRANYRRLKAAGKLPHDYELPVLNRMFNKSAAEPDKKAVVEEQRTTLFSVIRGFLGFGGKKEPKKKEGDKSDAK